MNFFQGALLLSPAGKVESIRIGTMSKHQTISGQATSLLATKELSLSADIGTPIIGLGSAGRNVVADLNSDRTLDAVADDPIFIANKLIQIAKQKSEQDIPSEGGHALCCSPILHSLQKALQVTLIRKKAFG